MVMDGKIIMWSVEHCFDGYGRWGFVGDFATEAAARAEAERITAHVDEEARARYVRVYPFARNYSHAH